MECCFFQTVLVLLDGFNHILLVSFYENWKPSYISHSSLSCLSGWRIIGLGCVVFVGSNFVTWKHGQSKWMKSIVMGVEGRLKWRTTWSDTTILVVWLYWTKSAPSLRTRICTVLKVLEFKMESLESSCFLWWRRGYPFLYRLLSFFSDLQ